MTGSPAPTPTSAPRGADGRPSTPAILLGAGELAVLGDEERAAVGWIAQFAGHTRRAYWADLTDLARWAAARGWGLFDLDRARLGAYLTQLADPPEPDGDGRGGRGLSRATAARRAAAVASFYTWSTEEGWLPADPAARLRRPKVPADSPTQGLTRAEAGRLLAAAELTVLPGRRGRYVQGPRDLALVCLLLREGLRVAEATGALVADLAEEGEHRVLWVTRKGGARTPIPLVPETHAAIRAHLTEPRLDPHTRTLRPPLPSDPLLAPTDRLGAKAMTQQAADRTVARLARYAGIAKKLSPHSLRHTAATLALQAGVPLHRVQDMLGHADPRTTRRYDRARLALDGHAVYALSPWLAAAVEQGRDQLVDQLTGDSREVDREVAERDTPG